MTQGHSHPATHLDPLLSSPSSTSVPRLRYSLSRLVEYLGVVFVSLAVWSLISSAWYWGGVLLVLGTSALVLGFRRSRFEEDLVKAALLSLIRGRSRELGSLYAHANEMTREELTDALAASLDELSSLPEQALWKVARDHFPIEAASRLETLNLKAQREGLTASEENERDELLSGYERVMVLRAEAARLLNQRGHDVSVLHGAG